MDLANRVFRNNKTGETIRVIDSFEDIVILENKQRINIKQLMDADSFTEQIDPNSFFSNQVAYNALADKIKTIPTNNIIDEGGDVVSINVDGDQFRPTMNESAIIVSSEEDEMAELARKYGATLDNDATAKQQAAFDRILNPVDEQATQATQVVVNNHPDVKIGSEYTLPVQRIEVEDPIITMFKRTKRNVNFNVSVEISDMIPRLDFIEMMEDSYEISIIDFLADEFTNKILNDPSRIRNKVKDRINQLVYGVEKQQKTEKVEEETIKVEVSQVETTQSVFPSQEESEITSTQTEKTEQSKKNTKKRRITKETDSTKSL